MLNAKTCRDWLIQYYQGKNAITCETSVKTMLSLHMCAASTNLEATKKFGLKDENVFGFWDYVGGRYSVCSAVGVLPLSIHFGYQIMEQFLEGANSIDKHFRNELDFSKNIPIMLGLLGLYHVNIQGNYSNKKLCM